MFLHSRKVVDVISAFRSVNKPRIRGVEAPPLDIFANQEWLYQLTRPDVARNKGISRRPIQLESRIESCLDAVQWRSENISKRWPAGGKPLSERIKSVGFETPCASCQPTSRHWCCLRL